MKNVKNTTNKQNEASIYKNQTKKILMQKNYQAIKTVFCSAGIGKLTE